ncbi:MAG TPA: glutamine amidotransferase [Chloroflexota bacterium]|nr:glutamine amidotransferase [Chloroflexota bacterium]
MRLELHLIHIYPRLLNLYGDRGNIITLSQRCAWRGISLQVHEVGLGDPLPECPADLVFIGGDQDREQTVVARDLRHRHATAIRDCVELGTVLLAVCGGYQLLQRYYRTAAGAELEGIGLFNAYTIHPGAGTPRCVGNIVVEVQRGTIVGFENHGGRTYLEGATRPLGRVVLGHGNNGQDGFEGARVANAFGTYVHGSLLPKNPDFADELLTLALQRRYPGYQLAPLDDSLERLAHRTAMARARVVKIPKSVAAASPETA